MTEENVVQLPSLLDRLASKLVNYLSQEAANRQEWIAIQEGICLTLVEARDQFPADIEFGRWCEGNGLGKDVLDYNTRALAIDMGRYPDELRKCLEDTNRRSLRTIAENDFPRFHNAVKPTTRRKKPRNYISKVQIAAEAIRPLIEAEAQISETTLGEKLGVSRATIQRARERELGRLEGLQEQSALAPDDMPLSVRKRYEAALRKARKELREEITAEINAVYDVYVKRRHERDVWAERIIASHKGVISKDAFRKIKACLHPDHNTFAHAADALLIFSDLEKILVKPDEPAAGPPLPTTAELMARRREYQGKHR